MRTYITYNKNQDLNLTKAYFKAIKTNKKGLLIDSIYFGNQPENRDCIYSYDELMLLKTEFYFRKPKIGWYTYKTFKGLMSRLWEDTKTIKTN